MKLVIIPIDGAVYIDGLSYSELDLSMCPSNVHALQWKETFGWIEYVDNEDGTKPQNQKIEELPTWALAAKQKWEDAKVFEEKLIAEFQKKQEIPVTVASQD